MSLFWKSASLVTPRFRSASRDALSGERRLSGIRRSIQAAIEDAEKEKEGLQLRVKEAADRAAFLFGDELEDQVGDDPSLRADLNAAEEAIMKGQKTLASLQAELNHLRTLKAQVYLMEEG